LVKKGITTKSNLIVLESGNLSGDSHSFKKLNELYMSMGFKPVKPSNGKKVSINTATKFAQPIKSFLEWCWIKCDSDCKQSRHEWAVNQAVTLVFVEVEGADGHVSTHAKAMTTSTTATISLPETVGQ
jgi:hypothetical protein